MAKSIRSKRVKANKAQKRIKYGKKELKKLKDMVQKSKFREEMLKDSIAQAVKKIKSEPVKDDSNPADSNEPSTTAVIGPKDSKNSSQIETQDLTISPPSSTKSEYNPVTLKNKHGNFPPWMNRRAIKRFKASKENYWKKRSYVKEKIAKRKKYITC